MSDNKFKSGIYNIYKPVGPTSYDIIRRIKRLTEEKRIGHGGTLDPLASGVLIVAIGKQFTKKLDKIIKLEKCYEATIKLGFYSTTDDEEGEKTEVNIKKIPSEKNIKDCLRKFEGEISQLPPIYSAKKVDGERAYKKARKGEKFDLEPRKVSIYEINLIEYEWPDLKIKVKCSSGTYIRSLARDIGKCLKTGGYLSFLKRTSIGDYKINNSIKL